VLVRVLVEGSLCRHWSTHLAAHLIVVLWAELPNLGAYSRLIFEIFVATQNDRLQACFAPLPPLVTSGIENEVVILEQFLPIPRWILLHGVGVLYHLLDLNWRLLLLL
jgi:hypothetical protein